jgi:hypothetical protein
MSDLGQRTMRKVIWRLVPFLALLYTFNIIDRANVGFARLGMVGSLGFSDAVIDWGYGIFYVGYLIFEVPCNMLLRRFGARRWIARIMISWGFVSALTACVVGTWSYFGARILLGVAAEHFVHVLAHLLFNFFREAAKHEPKHNLKLNTTFRERERPGKPATLELEYITYPLVRHFIINRHLVGHFLCGSASSLH